LKRSVVWTVNWSSWPAMRSDRLVRAQIERVALGDLAVVFERLGAAGLLVGVEKGMSPISSSSGVVKKVMCAG